MSTEIDRRVVEMQFNNKDFEKNVQSSLTSIEKLKMALNFDGGKGFDSLTKAANKMNLSNVDKQLEQVQVRFSSLQIVGYTVIQELTKAFISFGKNIWGSTFGQIKSGGMSRALKIEQAEFKMAALAKNMFDASLAADVLEGKINGLMQQMSTAIDNAVTNTAYGYDAAADVASQLMASGIRDAEKMERYLRGIAGSAAMTGNSFEQLGHVFTTVASNGKLMTMQLRQFSTYGLNLSATLAQQLGKTEAQINEMVTDGKITFEMFADSLAEAYGKAAGKADDTFAGVTTNIKAQLSRLGQRFAQPFIRNTIPMLKEVKAAIKSISAALAPMAERFDKSFGYFTNWLKELIEGKNFKKTETFFRALENVIYSVVLVMHSLYKAVKRVFPKSFTEVLYDISKAFLDISVSLVPTEKGLRGIENVFTGLLIPLKLIAKLLSGVGRFIKPILRFLISITKGIAELFSFTEPLIKMAVDFLNKSGILTKAFNLIANSIWFVLNGLKLLVSMIAILLYQISQSDTLKSIVNGFKNFGKAVYSIGQIVFKFLCIPLNIAISAIRTLGKNLPSVLSTIASNAEKLYNKVYPKLQALFDIFNFRKTDSGTVELEKTMSGVQYTIQTLEKTGEAVENIEKTTGALDKLKSVLVSIATVVKERLQTLTAAKLIFGSFGVAAVALVLSLVKLNDAFTRFTLTIRQIPLVFTRINQTLHSFNKYIAPSMLITSFSIAIGVLAVSLKQISEIPAVDLERASSVIVKFGAALMAFTFIMNKTSTLVTDVGQVVTIMKPAGGLIISLALSMLILAKSMQIINNAVKEIDDIGKIFSYLADMMLLLTVSMIGLARLAPAMQVSSLAFVSFATSIYVLTKAVNLLTEAGESITKENIVSIITLMISFATAISLTAKATAGGALAILTFATSLINLVGVMSLFAKIPDKDIEKGLQILTKIFESLLPLIIAIGIANALTGKGQAALGMKNDVSGGLGGLLLSLSVFMLAFAGVVKILENSNPEAIGLALQAMTNVLSLLTIVTGFMMAIHVITEIAMRKTLDATKGITLISRSVAEMGWLIIALAGATVMLAYAANLISYLPSEHVLYIGLLFLVIAEVMTEMVTETKNLVGVNIGPILGLIASIITIMGSLALLTFAAKDDPNAVMAAGAAIAAALAGLALALKGLAGFQHRQLNTNVASATDELLAIMGVLGLVAFILVYVVKTIEDKNITIEFTETMKVIILGMAAIAIASAAVLGWLNKIRVDQLVFATGDKLWKLVALFGAIMVSMMAVSASMLIVGKIPDGKLLSSAITVGVIAVAMLGILSVLPTIMKLWKNIDTKSFMEVGAGMAILSASLLAIAGALAIIGNFTDVDRLTGDAIALGGLFAALSIAMVALVALDRNFDGATVSNVGIALLEASGGILAIAAAFALLSKAGATPEEITSYALSIGLIVAAFTIFAAVVMAVASRSSTAIPVLESLTHVFISLGITLASIGLMMLGISEAFKTFGNTTDKEVNKCIDAFLIFARRIPEIINTVSKSIIEAGPAVGLALVAIVVAVIEAIAVALSATITVVLESLSIILGAIVEWLAKPETIQLIHDATYVLGKVFMEGIMDGIFDYINDNPKVQKFWDKIFGTFDISRAPYTEQLLKEASGYQDYRERIGDSLNKAQHEIQKGSAEDFAETGRYIVEQMILGIQDGETDLAKETERLSRYGLQGLEFILSKPDFGNDLNAMGEYFVAGLNQGIENGYLSFEQATAILAQYGLEGFADRLKIQSPSKVMNQMGKYTVMGLLEAVKDGEMTFGEAMKTLAQQGVDSFTNIFTDENLLKNFSLGGGGGKTREQFVVEASEIIFDYKHGYGTNERWKVEGFESIDAYVEQKLSEQSEGYDLLEALLGGFNTEELFKDFDINSLTEGLNDFTEAEDKATDYTDKLKDSIESTLDVFTEFNKEVKLTGREILANFYSQIDGVQTWQKELEELATRGMNKNFLNQLAEEGPKAYDRIHAFYNMTEAEMTLFNTMYAQKLMIQRSSQNQIRKTFVATGNMMEDELNKFETSIGEQYDEKLARAQAKAANSKAGTIAESTQKSLDSMYEEIEKYESDTEFIEQWKDNIASSSVKLDLMNAFSQLGYSSIDAFAQSMNFQKVMEKILQFKQTVKEQVKSSLNLFDEVKEVEEKDKMTTTEILNNMEENLKRVGGWSNNLKKMIKMGFSEGLIEELRQMGPESAEKVEAFVKMTAAEVKMANRYWGDSVQLPESISDRLTDEYAKAGFEISLGLKKGLDEGSEDFYEHFRTAGEDASQGYVDGIDSEAANEAMDQLGQNTLDRLMTKLDEHSPSREMMKIGANAVAGYLIGLKKGIKGLGTFTNELGSKVMDGFTKNISFTDTMSTDINDVLNTMTDKLYNVGNAASMIDMNDIYEPVIRPVWDTTAIENGFTTIDQLLSGKTISLKAVNDSAQRSGPSQDAVMITNAINNLYNEQRIIRGEINSLNSNMSTLGNRIDGMYVRLDGNALVGQIVSPMDKAMGKKVVTQKRGRV